MKLLIIGSGGREHALAWKLQQSSKVGKIYCAPGNGGTGDIAENVAIPIDDIPAIVNFAVINKIDLVVIGPELPLTLGLVDALNQVGILAFGPSKMAAELEGSKAFSKEFMKRHGIPTAKYGIFQEVEPAKEFIASIKGPWVIKADGLAAGKGVIICDTLIKAYQAIDHMLADNLFGSAGACVVIEEFLEGQELSLMAFSDGKTVIPMITAQDHKRIYDGDKGPNTGGMGAYAPAPLGTSDLIQEATKNVLEPVIKAMAAENREFKGILYAGLMITNQGVKVLEFNARFGDPETEVILPLLNTDLVDIMLACIEGELKEVSINWQTGSCVTVVMAAHGYPENARKGDRIEGLDKVPKEVMVFHCGTKKVYSLDENQYYTNGGRVLSVTATGDTLVEALKQSYQGVEVINFDGVQYRKDIAYRAL